MLSVVVPCYREQEVLTRLEARLRPVLDGLDEPYEAIFVDDGSPDATLAVLEAVRSRWAEVRVLRLGRNSGHQAALAAGLAASVGDWVLTLDADLQDPPELIPQLLAAAREQGVDVVYAQRSDRSSDTAFKRRSAGVYYRLLRRFGQVDLPPDVGDFRLLSRRVVDVLDALPEKHRVYRLLIPWLGYPSTTVGYARERRAAGSSKYRLTKMVALAFTSLSAFTTSPLRLATATGVLTGLLSAILGLWAVGTWLLGHVVPGWTSIVVPMFFLGSVQLICIGLLGEYVGRIFEESQRRPLFHVTYDSAHDTAPPAGRPSAQGQPPQETG